MIWLQIYIFTLFNALLFFLLKKEGHGRVRFEYMARGVIISAVIVTVFSFIGYKKLIGYSPSITFFILVLVPAALWLANKYDPEIFQKGKRAIIWGLACFFLMIFTLSISIWSSNYDNQIKDMKLKYRITETSNVNCNLNESSRIKEAN
jgi:CDP-diglyceride synthetase